MTHEEAVSIVARTLFVCDYADGVEEGRIEGPKASAREDWFDVAPEKTTDTAVLAARDLLAQIPMHPVMCKSWVSITGDMEEDFYHYLAMTSLGHGVGLQDDLPPYITLNIQIPAIEGYGLAE